MAAIHPGPKLGENLIRHAMHRIESATARTLGALHAAWEGVINLGIRAASTVAGPWT